jgi:RNA polymerase sigma-70 factor (ECF subfamily)
MQAMDRFDTQYRFFTWIYRITTNLAINYSKKKMRRHEVHFNEAYSAEGQQVIEDNVADIAAGEQLIGAVSKAVEKLTPALKAVFVLRIDQQLSYSEIAESLDIALGTVMSRLNRARTKIREELGSMLGEWE